MYLFNRINSFYKKAQDTSTKLEEEYEDLNEDLDETSKEDNEQHGTKVPSGTEQLKQDENSIPASQIKTSDIESFCKKLGIDFDYMKFLGAGEYNKVFLYQNKVLKFTKSKQDVKSIQRLDELKKQAPKELKKHFLNVYQIKYDFQGTDLYLIEVEMLEPLNAHIAGLAFPHSDVNENQYNYKHLLKTPEFLSATIDEVINKFPANLKNIITDIKNEYISLASTVNINKKYKGGLELLEDFNKFFIKNYSNKFKLTPNVLNNIVKAISLKLLHNVDSFPFENDDISKFKHLGNMPEFKNIYSFIKYLDEQGIQFSDLHQDNLMERPGTKDIVLSDPGLFQF